MGEMAGDRSAQPLFDEKDRKILFYLLVAIATTLTILALFAFAYAGTINPADLFHIENLTFSYTGAPAYTNLYADNYFIGLSGINSTVTNLTLQGPSDLTLYPRGNITVRVAGRSPDESLPPEQHTISLRPGDAAWVTINVLRDDDFNYNMYFNYDRPNGTALGRNMSTPDLLKVVKKGNSLYVINASSLPGAWKAFGVKNEPCWCFPITITVGKNNGDTYGVKMDVERVYNYVGAINVTTTGGLWVKSPVSAISPDSRYSKLELDHAEGILDIKHIEYKCNPADSISISPLNHTNISLMNGQIVASGFAKELHFREQSFGEPITVIIKGGNFAILTGLLSSFLTLILARLITTIKKK
jgi:hypothetical protein